MTFAFYNIIPHIQLFTWLFLHVAVFATRIVLRNKIASHIYIFFFLISFSSFLFAVFAWLTLMYGEGIHMLFVGMTIASISAGSMTTLGSVFNYFAAYVSIQMVGLISAFLYYNQQIFYLSALLAVLFLIFILSNGYKQFTNLKVMLRLNEQVNDLLNNASQGFLSFNTQLKCESSFSSECKRIFNLRDIKDLDISQLLFNTNESDKELFNDGISRAINEDDESIKDIFLSLLPKKQTIQNREIEIEYKHLKNNKFMLILTDVTRTNRLKYKLKHQNQIQNMIVAVASDKNDFIELKDNFKEFTRSISKIKDTSSINIKDIRSELHTFKGIFVQKEMIYIANYIHYLEMEIRHITSCDQVIYMVIEANLQKIFDKDIELIHSTLGDDFLSSAKSINVDIDSINDIELKLSSLSSSLKNYEKKKLDNILTKVHRLKYESLKQMLTPYISHVKLLSHKLEKKIYELNIQGDKDIKVSPRFKPFIKSLTHLFNNCVDHGIEDIERRTELNKDEVGSIKCNFEIISDMLILKISDDGRGIDTKELTLIAIDRAIKTKEELELMSEEEKCQLIFTDQLSTKENISTTSGIGIGMSVINENLEKLHGKYSIQNEPDVGVTFTFYIPLTINTDDETKAHVNRCKNICETISNQIEIYLLESLNLPVKSEKVINEITIKNNYAQIDFYGGFNGSVVMLYSDEIKEHMNSTIIPNSFNKKDREWLIQELPDEVLNTVIGLSLQSFDSSMGDVNISPPVHLDNLYLMKIVQKAKNKFIQEIDTSIGKITCIVIEKENK